MRGTLQLAGLCDTNQELARRAGRPFGSPAVYGSASEALREIRPELVILCTPPQTHRSLGIEALEAGAHLFMEKPMALTESDCRALINTARERERRLCVAFSQSFSPAVWRAREAVAAGEIGPLRGMNIFLSTPADYMTHRPDHWVHRLPGGFLSETGPHVIHLAMSFLGNVRDASLENRKHLSVPWTLADDLRIQLSCERGNCSATLFYAGADWAARVDLLGEKGLLTLDLENDLLLRHRRRTLRPAAVWKSEWDKTLQTLGHLGKAGMGYLLAFRKSGHDRLLEQFVRSVMDGSAPPVLPEEGREVARVLEQLTARLKPTV